MRGIRWWVVGLIFWRELRDQLRDRRTLFMVFVLPMLLYPILGFLIVQLTAAFVQQSRVVVVLGAEGLPDRPALLNRAGNGFAPELFARPEEALQYRVIRAEKGSGWDEPRRRTAALRRGDADAVLVLPPELERRLEEGAGQVEPEVIADGGRERSGAAAREIESLIAAWQQGIVRGRLARDQKQESYVEPVRVRSTDVARVQGSSTNVWLRMFPFLLVMMTLTGAFYPAVDLCAGEKERGTMETLLISPASRPEIVLGKFFTVMAASLGTAVANLLSMGITALQVSGMTPAGTSQSAASNLAMPSAATLPGMVVVMVPLAAFFSALCLALAAMARSMKEGQYYLTPLYLVAMPLVFATLMPGIELNMFTSLVPVTGASLLLKALMQGKYAEVRSFLLPVLVPLGVYAALALKWAVEQFRNEAVLFRESERFELTSWLRHVVRDRRPWPTSGEALFCFATMLAASWYSTRFLSPSWAAMVQSQLACIALPAVGLAFLLSSSPRSTLLWRRPRLADLALAVGLALALNPAVSELRQLIETFFPISDSLKKLLGAYMGAIPNLWIALTVLALVPAVCEELAFRGFILQGLRSGFSTLSAILLSAFLFGILHVLVSVFQQLFNATLLGIVLGLIAVRTRSLAPGIAFHFVNNALAVLVGTLGAGQGPWSLPGWLFRDPAAGLYRWPWVVLCSAVAAGLILVLLPERHQAPASGEVDAHNGPSPG